MYDVTVNIQPSDGGNVSPSTDSTYEEGETITLNATPSDEYLFKNWSGDIDSSANPLTFDIDQNLSLSANFEIKQYQLKVNTVGEGTVEEEIVNQKSTDYDYGTTVELTANPSEGWRFNNWKGGIEGNQNPEQITIDEEKSVTAVFEEGGYVSHGYVEGVTPNTEEIFSERTYPTIRADWEGVGGDKLWTKWNLGAIAAPENATDQDPEKRGWVFQFNRLQGYHYDGDIEESNRIPQKNLESSIDEDVEWEISNDPCRQLLGGSWRLPTLEEWDAYYNAYKTGTFNPDIYQDDAFKSPLQIHSPFRDRGRWGTHDNIGAYWSATQFGDRNGRFLKVPSTGDIDYTRKSNLILVRCIKD
ncbi:InlB B-repeat-containing protein [Fodinibius sp. SL11]|uniref:InlB B-repeat-containing protein n=1 Tax=Fodinibius sp. SL11 TaxID=3425690 RepID=UPI003F8849D3